MIFLSLLVENFFDTMWLAMKNKMKPGVYPLTTVFVITTDLEVSPSENINKSICTVDQAFAL